MSEQEVLPKELISRRTLGSYDKTVQVWNAATGDVLYTYNGYNVKAAKLNPAKGVLPDLILNVAWSPDGKYVVTGVGYASADVSLA